MQGAFTGWEGLRPCPVGRFLRASGQDETRLAADRRRRLWPLPERDCEQREGGGAPPSALPRVAGGRRRSGHMTVGALRDSHSHSYSPHGLGRGYVGS
jgi:hypothetical protein